jgi:hypothetical protein
MKRIILVLAALAVLQGCAFNSDDGYNFDGTWRFTFDGGSLTVDYEVERDGTRIHLTAVPCADTFTCAAATWSGFCDNDPDSPRFTASRGVEADTLAGHGVTVTSMEGTWTVGARTWTATLLSRDLTHRRRFFAD